MERKRDLVGLDAEVAFAAEVAVEHAAQRIAGQVLETRVDDQPVRTAAPGRGGVERPAHLARQRRAGARDGGAVGVQHLEGVFEHGVVERTVECEPERGDRAFVGNLEPPVVGADRTPQSRADGVGAAEPRA